MRIPKNQPMRASPAASEFKPVESLSQFVQYVEDIKRRTEAAGNPADLIFRGQPCDLPLIPRLGRLALRGKLDRVEKLIVEEFKRTMTPLTEFHPDNEWDVLAVAQHHGLPTRLLDWTQSASSALWFTVRAPFRPDKRSDAPQAGVVWVFAAEVGDYLKNINEASPFDDEDITKIFRPQTISRRIVAQAGVFTAHKLLENKRFVALEKNKYHKHKLTKLVIQPENFARLRKDLHMFNVNHMSQFPDLDGLARHLEWRYSWYDDEEHAGDPGRGHV